MRGVGQPLKMLASHTRSSRHNLHARGRALLTDLVHGEQHLPCRSVAPEPIRQRRTVDGAVPRLRCEGHAVVGVEILYRVSEKRGQGDIYQDVCSVYCSA